MKYSIVTKFIAVTLCAAALLGICAGAGGVLVLTGCNLYSRTVEDLESEQIEDIGQSLSTAVALAYASKTLGGCSDSMVTERFPYCYNSSSGLVITAPALVDGRYGYTLKDAEGNVLQEKNSELREEAQSILSFSPQGQYMYLLNAKPVQRETQPELDLDEPPQGEIRNIPADGADVYVIRFTLGDESSTGLSSADAIGYLYLRDDGAPAFWATQDFGFADMTYPAEITQIAFYDQNGEILYSSASDTSVGRFYIDESGRVAFEGFGENNATSFYRAEFFGPDGNALCRLDSQSPLGAVLYDEAGETILFDVSTDFLEAGTAVSRLVLSNESGRVIYTWSTGNGAMAVHFEDQVLKLEALPAAQSMASETAPSTEATVQEAPSEVPEGPAAPQEGGSENGEAPQAENEPPAEEPVPEGGEPAEEPQQDGEFSEEPPVEEPQEGGEPAEEPPAEEPPAEEPQEGAEPVDAVPAEEPQEGGEPAEEPSAETEAPTEAPTEASTEATVETMTSSIDPMTYPEYTEPVLVNGTPLDEYGRDHLSYYESQTHQDMEAEYIYVALPEYEVELYLMPDALQDQAVYSLLRVLRQFRNELFLVLGISVLVFAMTAVYLCCAAGHKPKQTEIRAGGLNRTPLDLYLGFSAAAIFGLILLLAEFGEDVLQSSLKVGIAMGLGCAYLGCLIVVGFLFAVAAQAKTPGTFWLSNTLCVWLLTWALKILVVLWQFVTGRLLPWCVRLVKKIFTFCFGLVKRFFTGCRTAWDRFLRLLPLTWQALVTGLGMLLLLFIGVLSRSGGLLFLIVCCELAVVLYISRCFGALLEGVKNMSKGDLDTKVEDKHMVGAFREFAGDLNALADVAVVAAQKQLRSERMKTELITNVSHDIKTPLTSIINYVDLLQKPHTQQEQQDYLEVLDRQSQRLKKLIEDLMDMSKASTGNMPTDITRLDAVEAVNQALGEFADKLEKAQLYPLFRHEKDQVPMMADGRLTWRVLSNLLSNAVKYAMPGTRVYIDLMEAEGKVLISLKNISRDELNIGADELMERFVRGDDSRNTEGSGLGLNIAKSLMELQKGQLQLLVDGDLFKVTLIFPGA